MATEPTNEPSTESAPPNGRRAGLGLSSKLLFLTVLFVMVAEVLIYVPSIANFRLNWLNDRLAAATPRRWCSMPRPAAWCRKPSPSKF